MCTNEALHKIHGQPAVQNDGAGGVEKVGPEICGSWSGFGWNSGRHNNKSAWTAERNLLHSGLELLEDKKPS